MVYWQTIQPVSITSLRTTGTRDPIQRVVYERTQTLSTQAWPLSVADQSSVIGSSRSQWITKSNTTSARLTVCLKNSRSRFLRVVCRCVLWLNDASYSKSVWADIGVCLLGARCHNLQPCAVHCTLTLRATMHSVTDRQADRRATWWWCQ